MTTTPDVPEVPEGLLEPPRPRTRGSVGTCLVAVRRGQRGVARLAAALAAAAVAAVAVGAVPAHAASWAGNPRPGVSARGQVSTAGGAVRVSGWVMDTRDDRKGVELRITATDHYWCVFGGCFTRRSEVVIKNNRGYYRSVDFARQWPVRDGWDTLELRECSTDRREVVCAPAKVIWRG